ncbi:hypothetical protein M0R45_007779 [Rubus argutus]|uniref:Magnesium transporter n=1 Tax=Rubus argutus TaxID=59490 RepID=A0AAW1Y1R4_RUBAR
MHKVHIHARDFRIVDPLLSYPSTILVRDRAIVLNLEHIKAIITAKEVLLWDPWDENVIPVVEELQRRLPPARESETHVDYAELETTAYPALDELTSKISSRNLDRVRNLKNAMTRLTSRVQKVRDELEQLLDDDDDMMELYLSRKLAGASSPVSRATVGRDDENDVEELEMSLEAYFMQIDGTLNKLATLRLSIYSLVTAIFGMNIPYTWNDGHGYMFKWVCIVPGIVCFFVFVVIVAYARHKGLVGS